MKSTILFLFLLFCGICLAEKENDVLFKAHEFSGWFPPDAGVAVSHSRIVSAVNGEIALFKKTEGNNVLGRKSLTAFYKTPDGFDPRVLWSDEDEKFVVVVVNGRNSYTSTIELAYSNDGDINSLERTDWRFVSIKVPEDGMWLDYPMVGLDSYNFYITGNMFSDTQNLGNGGRLYIVPKANIFNTTGDLKEEQYAYYSFRNLTYNGKTLNRYGVDYGVQPSWSWSQKEISGRHFLINRYRDNLNLLEVSNIQSPSFDFKFNLYQLPIEITANIIYNAPQNGTTYTVETNDMRARQVMDIGGKLVMSHTSRNMSNTNCVARVYLVDISQQIPELLSLDEIGNGDVLPEPWYYYPATGLTEKGTMGTIMIRSATNEYVSIWNSYKKEDDKAFRTPKIIVNGTEPLARNRYGDYSSVALDPSDRLRLWYLAENLDTPTRWNMWIYSHCPDCSNEVDCGPHGTWKDGACICAKGWAGSLCDTCAEGYWGSECQPCPKCFPKGGKCLDGMMGNGTCECNGDYFGKLCEHTCKPHGTYHEGVCWCSAGYKGTYCDECRYGKNAQGDCMVCPEDCNGNGKCNENNGVCYCFEHFEGRTCASCVEGWQGPYCNESVVPVDCVNGEIIKNKCVCIDGWSGDDCSVYVGKCLNGIIVNNTCECLIGWAGKGCDTCAEGYWGVSCENECPWCNLHGKCNSKGECECAYGWQDARCQTCSWWYQPISIGKECQCGNCGPYGRCNVNTGECDCFNGWSGYKCSRCEPSEKPCGPYGKCSPDKTKCVCETGWYGWLCSEQGVVLEK